MMRNKHIQAVCIIFLLLFISIPLWVKVWAKDFSTAPCLNNGKKWRIAYYEGGNSVNYPHVLCETIKTLMKLGWLETSEVPAIRGSETAHIWKWLATQAHSKYLRFPEDAYYSAGWDKKRRNKLSDEIIARLNRNETDLMLAMGTWAGQDLANDRHHTPTMVLSSSDPVRAGIVKSENDSGYDHVHVRVDAFRYERQLRAFHNAIGFRKLGIAYENTVAGRSYAAVGHAEKLAKSCGFEIISCHAISDTPNISEAEKSLKHCFRELCQKADAIYVTTHGGLTANTIPQLAELARQYRIPTFFQGGMEGVRQGFLMTTSTVNFSLLGEFHAITAAKILNKTAPGSLPMNFENPYKLHFNFETAEKIGLDLSQIDLETEYTDISDVLK